MTAPLWHFWRHQKAVLLGVAQRGFTDMGLARHFLVESGGDRFFQLRGIRRVCVDTALLKLLLIRRDNPVRQPRQRVLPKLSVELALDSRFHTWLAGGVAFGLLRRPS